MTVAREGREGNDERWLQLCDDIPCWPFAWSPRRNRVSKGPPTCR
jgi:hypothetical protein